MYKIIIDKKSIMLKVIIDKWGKKKGLQQKINVKMKNYLKKVLKENRYNKCTCAGRAGCGRDNRGRKNGLTDIYVGIKK